MDLANLAGVKVAVLATNGIEQLEPTEPVRALKAASAEVLVIAPKGGQSRGLKHDQEGDKLAADQDIASMVAN